MSHAQNTYDFEIAEDDPHYEEISDYSLEMLWVYTYADKESLELDLMEILNQRDLLRGCDDQYFDYNVDEVYIPHQDKWNEHFPTPGKPNPNYYTDSGATFNKHLRTPNKLKQKRK